MNKQQTVKVANLKPGDRVLGADGKTKTVTAISPFGIGQKLISLDGTPDGVYFDSEEVWSAERTSDE